MYTTLLHPTLLLVLLSLANWPTCKVSSSKKKGEKRMYRGHRLLWARSQSVCCQEQRPCRETRGDKADPSTGIAVIGKIGRSSQKKNKKRKDGTAHVLNLPTVVAPLNLQCQLPWTGLDGWSGVCCTASSSLEPFHRHIHRGTVPPACRIHHVMLSCPVSQAPFGHRLSGSQAVGCTLHLGMSFLGGALRPSKKKRLLVCPAATRYHMTSLGSNHA